MTNPVSYTMGLTVGATVSPPILDALVPAIPGTNAVGNGQNDVVDLATELGMTDDGVIDAAELDTLRDLVNPTNAVDEAALLHDV